MPIDLMHLFFIGQWAACQMKEEPEEFWLPAWERVITLLDYCTSLPQAYSFLRPVVQTSKSPYGKTLLQVYEALMEVYGTPPVILSF